MSIGVEPDVSPEEDIWGEEADDELFGRDDEEEEEVEVINRFSLLDELVDLMAGNNRIKLTSYIVKVNL